MKLPILLVPHRDKFTSEYLSSLSHGPIIACDFYVDEAEKWPRRPGGYAWGRVTIIDHHAPDPDMWRHVSSTNLAMQRLSEFAQLRLGSPD